MYRRLERLHRLRVPRPALRRQDAPARRRPLPAAARPRRRRDHLRARDHPLHGAGLAARPRHRVHRVPRDRLHRHRRQRGRQPDAEVADGGDLRRHGDGLRRAAARSCPTASGSPAPRTWPARWASCRRWTSRSIRAGATRCGPACSAVCSSRSRTSAPTSRRCSATSAAPSLRESRLGLMFNAVLKIPMQFVILLLGALLFVFYQFAPPPVFFNQAEWRRHAQDGRPRHRGPKHATRRRAERVGHSRVAPGPRVGRRRREAERAGRHGRGQPPHRRGPRRGQGRPRWPPTRAPRPRTPTTSSSRSSSTSCRTGRSACWWR